MNNYIARHIILISLALAVVMPSKTQATASVQTAKTVVDKSKRNKKESKKEKKADKAKPNSKAQKKATATPKKEQKKKPVVYGRHGRRDAPDAASKAFAATIKKYNKDLSLASTAQIMDQFIEDSYKKYFKGDPSVYKSVAEAFWYNMGDTVRAMSYADKSLAIDSRYTPAYIIKGEVCAWCKDTLKAQEWYERAITANPTDTKGYEAVARLKMFQPDATAAEKAYARAKMAVPSYPANLKTARMYDLRANRIANGKLTDAVTGTSMTNVIQYYEKAERDSMEEYDYAAFAGWLFALGKLNKAYYAKGLEVAEEGLQRFPDDPQINRMGLYCSVMSQQYQNSLTYADKLMNSKDTTINHLDYRYVARAYMGKKNLTKGIKAFETLLAQEDATDEDRSYAIGQIATAYKDLGEYEKADEAYADYIAKRKAAGTLTFYDLWTYAQMYMDKAEESNGDAVVQAYMKADEIYAEAAKIDLEQAYMALYQRISIRTKDMIDPGYKKGMAVEPAKEVVALLSAQSQLTGNPKAVMVAACNYLGVYYLNVKEDKRQCLMYWRKLHSVDPTNENAIKVITSIFKQKL